MKVQYSERIDKVIYSDLTRDFKTVDWIRLTEAALDQAGVGRETDRDLQ